MSSRRYAAKESDDAERACREVRDSIEGNRFCADCGSPSPEYLNLTIGTFVCESCADIHKSSTNRQIKDMYGRELTREDVQRMRVAGNEKANSRFLARWNPREFPEPKPSDKEYLREFIWLKYEGSWKRAAVPQSSAHHRPDYSASAAPSSATQSGRSYFGPGRGPPEYGREREIFRGHSDRPEEPLRSSYWAQRYGPPAVSTATPVSRPRREENYQPYVDQASISHRQDYRRRPPPRLPSRPGRYDEPSLDEEYGSLDSGAGSAPPRRYDHRDVEPRRREKGSTSSKRSKKSAYVDEDSTSEDATSEDEWRRQKKSSKRPETSSVKQKSKAKSNGKSSKSRSKYSGKFVESESESDSDSESEDSNSKEKRSSHRGLKKKSSRKRRSKREQPVEESSEDSRSFSEDDGRQPRRERNRGKAHKQATTGSKEKGRRENPFDSEDDGGSMPEQRAGTSTVDSRIAAPTGSEFDLMSDWMGAETGTTTTAARNAVANNGTNAGSSPRMQPQQAQAQVIPPIVPPMSVYPGVMFPPVAGGVPGMFPPGGVMFSPGPGGIPMMNVGGFGAPQMVPNAAQNGVQTGPLGIVPGMQSMSIAQGQWQPPPPPVDHVHSTPQQYQPPPPAGPPPPE